MNTHNITIPESFLLTIAVHGNMGDGDLPELMQTWAEQRCVELGLKRQLLNEKNQRYEELKKRVANVWGNDVVNRIEKTAEIAAPMIKSALKSTQ